MGLGAGMTVGQAWLLDDVISLVSLLQFSPDTLNLLLVLSHHSSDSS
jgi:hypothetical protein